MSNRTDSEFNDLLDLLMHSDWGDTNVQQEGRDMWTAYCNRKNLYPGLPEYHKNLTRLRNLAFSDFFMLAEDHSDEEIREHFQMLPEDFDAFMGELI